MRENLQGLLFAAQAGDTEKVERLAKICLEINVPQTKQVLYLLFESSCFEDNAKLTSTLINVCPAILHAENLNELLQDLITRGHIGSVVMICLARPELLFKFTEEPTLIELALRNNQHALAGVFARIFAEVTLIQKPPHLISFAHEQFIAASEQGHAARLIFERRSTREKFQADLHR